MALIFPFILLRSAPPSLPGSAFIHYIKKINALIPELSFPHLPHIVSRSLSLRPDFPGSSHNKFKKKQNTCVCIIEFIKSA